VFVQADVCASSAAPGSNVTLAPETRAGSDVSNSISTRTLPVNHAALDDVGLAYMSDDKAAPHLASGALVRVLEDWCQPFPGFFLYYPSRRQQPAALSALVNALRWTA
jgi:DNA-binding transcriptional LysR family regulator